MGGNVRRCSVISQKISYHLTVASHVRVVHVAQKTDRAGAFCDQRTAKFKFNVFRAGAAQVPDEINAIRDFRHKHLAEADAPVAVLKFEDCAVGIAACVGGVVVSAVVVDGPVQELQMAVAADRIEVKEVCRAKLAGGKFQPADSDPGSNRK